MGDSHRSCKINLLKKELTGHCIMKQSTEAHDCCKNCVLKTFEDDVLAQLKNKVRIVENTVQVVRPKSCSEKKSFGVMFGLVFGFWIAMKFCNRHPQFPQMLKDAGDISINYVRESIIQKTRILRSFEHSRDKDAR